MLMLLRNIAVEVAYGFYLRAVGNSRYSGITGDGL